MERSARTTTSIAAGIGTFILLFYWLVILVPARPIDRIIDQYGLFIVLAILVAATIAAAVAAVRLSRWWAVALVAGVAAVIKYGLTIRAAWQ